MNVAAKTVQVSFSDPNAIKTADVSLALAEGYIKYDVEKRSESAKKVLAFINTQLNEVYNTLRISENSIQEFHKDNRLSKSDGFTKIYLDRLNGLESELIALEMESKILEEIGSSISGDTRKIDAYNLLPLIIGTQFEESIKGLVSSLNDLLIRKEELLYDVKLESENIKSINYQIEIQKKLLVQSIRSLHQKLNNRITNIKAKASEFEKSFLEIPTQELEYARLERVFSINEQFYELLLQKRTEYELSKAGFVPNNTILEKSYIPQEPISPDKIIAIISAILVTVLLSIGLIVIRYLLHNTISSTRDVVQNSTANISTLGVIPKYNKDIPISQLVVNQNPKSLIAESFRALRSNLQFISNAPGSKIAAVTSTVSGEGKTFVAINLAGIIAFSGKKVVIIDLDMRKPKIHIGFEYQMILE